MSGKCEQPAVASGRSWYGVPAAWPCGVAEQAVASVPASAGFPLRSTSLQHWPAADFRARRPSPAPPPGYLLTGRLPASPEAAAVDTRSHAPRVSQAASIAPPPHYERLARRVCAS